MRGNVQTRPPRKTNKTRFRIRVVTDVPNALAMLANLASEWPPMLLCFPTAARSQACRDANHCQYQRRWLRDVSCRRRPCQPILVEVRIAGSVEHLFDPTNSNHIIAAGRNRELKVLCIVVPAVGCR